MIQQFRSMEYNTHFLTLSPPIHQAIDLPATHQLSSDLSKSNTSLLYSNQQMRVSQKLLQNKIRKLQIEYQKQQQKQSLLERRRRRQKQIYLFQKRRQALAQQQRETSLRSNRNELTEKFKNEEEQRLVKINQMQASDAMINLCRKRVQEKKQEYIIRIQNKTRERQERAHRKRKMIERATQKTNDQIHLEQWKQYEAQILKKHENETMRPDRLYQQFKKKNIELKSIFQEKSKQNRQILTPQPHKSHANQAKPQVQGLNRINTGQPYFRVSKKTQFYGVHEEDMMKKTVKDLGKMRKFIEEHTIQSDPENDQLLVDKFEEYLLKQILK